MLLWYRESDLWHFLCLRILNFIVFWFGVFEYWNYWYSRYRLIDSSLNWRLWQVLLESRSWVIYVAYIRSGSIRNTCWIMATVSCDSNQWDSFSTSDCSTLRISNVLEEQVRSHFWHRFNAYEWFAKFLGRLEIGTNLVLLFCREVELGTH